MTHDLELLMPNQSEISRKVASIEQNGKLDSFIFLIIIQ